MQRYTIKGFTNSDLLRDPFDKVTRKFPECLPGRKIHAHPRNKIVPLKFHKIIADELPNYIYVFI